MTELQIHSKLSHPNVVAFYRAFSFQTSTYVVLELCSNGSLADMLKKRKCLTLPEIRRFVIQICGAAKYLHHRHIVHRDLKTGNLFLDKDMNIKVGDFGLAALLVTEKEMEVKRRTTMCGTPNYLAPEILEKGKGHDERADIWSIGVIAYTLAVGKAPFHSQTKEEIYKKLKNGEYKWPELSATTNDISSDLRDLVASLLVEEQRRPVPDRIVSHPFFKIAYIPASIPSSARERAPTWPEIALPSAEVQRRGYSDSWWHICKESGVGEYDAEGKCFPLNGGKRVRSVVHDMAKESQMGTIPTMPIAMDLVYVSNVSSWDVKPTESQQSERRPPSRNGMARAPSHFARPAAMDKPAARDVALMPPPPRPGSRAGTTATVSAIPAAHKAPEMPPPDRPASRVGRTGTVRKAARTISEETAKAAGTVKITADEISAQPTLKVPKTRQAPTATQALQELRQAPAASSATSRLQKSNTSSDSGYQTACTQQETQATEKPQRAGTVKRSADASLARRPKATAKKAERPTSPQVGPLATLDELKQVSPLKKTSRRKKAEAEVIEILSDPESDDQLARRALPDERPIAADLRLPPPPAMSKKLPVPKKVSKSSDALPGTDPESVLERLSTLQSNLATALSGRHPSSRHAPSSDEAGNLPFVSRWVDYSRKHGIGYVLSDGTVGTIINASTTTSTWTTAAGTTETVVISHPVTHCFIGNGQKWLSKVGKNFDHVDRIPLEILEDRGEEGIVRKVYKGLGSVKEGPLAAEAERKRTLSVLWVKFGRYMCLSLDGEESQPSSSSGNDGTFVRFYQRLGSVGIWAFSNGCLQIHFPDHTKLVISADGQLVSATCISTEAAAYLSANNDLLPHHVSSREIFADTIYSLLHEGGRIRSRTVKANALPAKLGWVAEVVGQWVGNGGMGKMDEDRGGEKIYWEGMTVKDCRKSDRATVGRYGGDEPLPGRSGT